MTVVTKYAATRPEGRQDAKIYPSGSQWAWYNLANESIDFVAGEWLVFRFSLDIPQGATITTAQFRFEYSQKDAGPAQTANMSLYFEQADNSAPWPYTEGMISVPPPTFPRTLDKNAQLFVISYPGGSTPGVDSVTQTVTTQIQALVNRAGWEAGNYVTMAILCTAEGSGSNMAIQMSEAWWATYVPQFDITYTYDDDTPARTDVNIIRNQTMDNTNEMANNEFYGYAMQNTTYDTVNWGRDGGPCLRALAHPPAGQETRAFVAQQSYICPAEETFVFTGWFYNPSSNANNFVCDFPYVGGGRVYPQKDEWTPFAAGPVTTPAGAPTGLWCMTGVDQGSAKVDGAWFLIDNVMLMRTNATEMPFTGTSTDKFNADYEPKETVTHGVTVRRNRRRTHVLISSVSRPRRNYVRDKQGLWVRADQQQMGTTWNQVAGSTWDAVGTSTTTWDTAG